MASKYSKKRAFEDEIYGKKRRPSYDYVIATTMRGSGFYLVRIDRLDNDVLQCTWTQNVEDAHMFPSEEQAYFIIQEIRDVRSDLNLKLLEKEEDDIRF